MKDEAASRILESVIAQVDAMSYDDVRRLFGEQGQQWSERADGIEYQVEVECFVEDRATGTLRVVVAVDGGRVSALKPLCDGFPKHK